MKRFVQSRTGLPVARLYPAASRLYSAGHGDIDAGPPKRMDEGKQGSSAAVESGLDGLFDFGEELSGLDYQNKTIKTAVGSLPISPLLDPTWRKARKPHKKKQPPPFKRMPRFQRNMKQNPYAQLLAESVRQCHVTRARLPMPFLQSFGLVTHPQTKELWWMPAGFEEPTKESVAITSDEAEAQPAYEENVLPSREAVPAETVSRRESAADTAVEHAGMAAEVQEHPPAKQSRPFWAPAHALARQDLLEELLDKRSKHGGGQFRFSMIQSIGDLVSKAIWRQDMHEVLRERMRRVLVDELINVSQTCERGDRNFLVKVNSPRDARQYQNGNCFLLLTGESKPFKYLGVAGVPGSARPVYHLPDLLGAEQMQRLKSASPLFGDDSSSREGALVLLKGKANIELNKKLWRLQGFVADYAELK